MTRLVQGSLSIGISVLSVSSVVKFLTDEGRNALRPTHILPGPRGGTRTSSDQGPPDPRQGLLPVHGPHSSVAHLVASTQAWVAREAEKSAKGERIE